MKAYDYTCVSCHGDFYSYKEDEPSLCHPCRKMRFVDATFTCPLCRQKFISERNYTYLLGKQVCRQCANTFHGLEVHAKKDNARAQHLLDTAKLILRPIHKQDKMIPVAIYSAHSRWGGRWVGPPSSENKDCSLQLELSL